jgi:F0F1-type ATP synthase membrane subunit b/b'
MKYFRRIALASVFFILTLVVACAWAQEATPAASGSPQSQAVQQPENPNAAIGSELSKESEKAVALFFWILLRGKIPAMFRSRTDSIQTAIREARAASAEATERLKAVESRLSKLDSEVAGIRVEAEKHATAEEQRIHAAAEEDKNRVVESAKMEIDAIARNARRELKSYASTLAVDIAAKRIHVDEHSDQALVRDFVDQLGKDGRQ